jgi:hypothetical protein
LISWNPPVGAGLTNTDAVQFCGWLRNTLRLTDEKPSPRMVMNASRTPLRTCRELKPPAPSPEWENDQFCRAGGGSKLSKMFTDADAGEALTASRPTFAVIGLRYSVVLHAAGSRPATAALTATGICLAALGRTRFDRHHTHGATLPHAALTVTLNADQQPAPPR